jgi:hypothetical protein
MEILLMPILPVYCPNGYISLLLFGSDLFTRNLVSHTPRVTTDAY